MATLFCSHCGFVIARGMLDDPQRAIQDSPHTACPGCGTSAGIGWSPADLSEQDIEAALNPSMTIARPGESPIDLNALLMQDALFEMRRQHAKRGLMRMGLVMLAVGIPAGAISLYFWPGRGWAVMVGVLAGMTAIWIIDRLAPSWLE
jgi:hypothetical protein